MAQKVMMFDVESIGLHGEGFAVGWRVLEIPSGKILEEDFAACSPEAARGGDTDRAWVRENVPTLTRTDDWPAGVRARFWQAWLNWKEQGAILMADCAWPVEARFLAACVDDRPDRNAWDGPYPLHDLATFILARGGNPIVTRDRNETELPAHNPLNDARQSARVLLEML